MNLPSPQLFVPNLDDIIGAAYPFIAILNYIIGGFGLYLLSIAAYHMIHAIRGLLNGTSSWKAVGNRMAQIVTGIVIIIMAFTGAWYTIILFLWEKVALKIINTFNQDVPKNMLQNKDNQSFYMDFINQVRFTAQYAVYLVKGVWG